MTGGAGFSRQASQSFQENHDLGKIRSKSSFFKSSRNLEKADLRALSDSIDYRIQRKSLVEKRRLLVVGIVVFLVMLVILAFAWD
jgi:hypothetical protein